MHNNVQKQIEQQYSCNRNLIPQLSQKYFKEIQQRLQDNQKEAVNLKKQYYSYIRKQIPQPLQKDFKRIQQRLQDNQKEAVNLKKYCQVCKLAVELNPQIIYREIKVYQSELNENVITKKTIGNQKSLIGFLLKANIIFPIVERVEIKKSEVMIEAGKKVTGVIFQAWNYYFQLIKGRKQQNHKKQQERTIKQVVLFDQENQRMAKKRIIYLLTEIQANKYRWQNYTKEGIVKIQQQKQEIEEEQAFIKLLQTMLNSQIAKIIRRRQELHTESEKKELQESQEKCNLGFLQQTQKKRLKKLLNIENFYKQKIIMRVREGRRDVIIESEEERKSNIIALRYCCHKKIEQ